MKVSKFNQSNLSIKI